MAAKSHRYVSQPKRGGSGSATYRVVVRFVIGKAYQVEGHLRTKEAMHDVVNVRSLTEETTEDMIERCQACLDTRGFGGSIQGIDGDVWGRVISDEGSCWRLHSGRIAKKCTEGVKWNWATTSEVSVDNLETV